MCIEEFFKLKSEIAQLIYSHIDLMLADKNEVRAQAAGNCSTTSGLKNPEYNHMYERKRALEKAVKELQGIRLSTGTLSIGHSREDQGRQGLQGLFPEDCSYRHRGRTN